MTPSPEQSSAPGGGLQVSPRSHRRWSWQPGPPLQSTPVRCKRDTWYLARTTLRGPATLSALRIVVEFIDDQEIIHRRCVEQAAVPGPDTTTYLGWFRSPETVTHVHVIVPDETVPLDIAEITLHPIAERDPQCHPLANLPRWSTYQPPFPIKELVVPTGLAPLADHLAGLNVTTVEHLGSPTALGKLAAGKAIILDPAWLTTLRITGKQLAKLAEHAWVIVDLDSFATAVRRGGGPELRTRRFNAPHEIMAARVEYADVATRGFAMQDVFPFAVHADDGYSTRVIVANRNWKRFSDEHDFATLLASETPYVDHCGDVLLAAHATAGGELLVTNIPWLAVQPDTQLLAPELTRHLARMVLGQPLSDAALYWNRWEEDDVLIRDIADAPRRYPEMQVARWASPDPAIAHLGLVVTDPGAPPTRQLVLCTGRADQADPHDGLAPEAVLLFMKWLARELRDATAFARRHLDGVQVIWQFDTATGLRHVVDYPSAANTTPVSPTTLVRLRDARWTAQPLNGQLRFDAEIAIPLDPGVFGDRSLVSQVALTERLRKLITDWRNGRALA
jgi:hypothetical protein